MLDSLPTSAAALTALLMHVAAPSDDIECIGISPRELKRVSAVVLEGTVRTLVAPYPTLVVLTVNVHRVWKGAANRKIELFLQGNVEAPRVKVGDRRVFFAEPESAESQKSGRMFLFTCGGAEVPTPEVISRLGASRRPR